jgi:capsule biosynthesis phosphatase
MRICFDLDGVICKLRQPEESYAELELVPGAVEKMTALRAAGHTLIIATARHMKTCDGNVGLVQARLGKVTLDWLDRHGVPFDEIYFGKPWAEVYADDNAFHFTDWNGVDADGANLAIGWERRLGEGDDPKT